MPAHWLPSGLAAALAAALALSGCSVGRGGGAATVQVGGALDRPTSFSARALAKRPTVTQNVQYISGSGTQQRSYIGVDLWSLLSDLGIQTDPAGRNDTLNRYVLATVGTSTYTGVSLWTLLDSVTGLQADAGIKTPLLSMYAVATGSDGYKTMVSVGEIHPNFGKRDALVAYAVDGAPLDRNGMARLVVPGDARASRHVSNLVAIEVFTAPAAR
ncbi:molybdopterin-dependent oxidoreductase [Pseudorhodoferax sp.]|uniref:molybdopterin-dependent oxidoreductase n=1 Tax=Pseudorhodoferax sp. TaxID=1993553 RepID=UPI002DD67F04|nr:molybdopterin-dependent oxidoreductase [Pseudorhodoferax sp.]